MTWSQIAQYPVALPWDANWSGPNQIYGAETGGKIYLFATTGIANTAVPYQFYEYNPATNVYTSKAVPTGEGGGSSDRMSQGKMCAGNGHVYILGGVYQSGILVYSQARFLDYTIATNTWATKALPPLNEAVTNTSSVMDVVYCNGAVWASERIQSTGEIKIHKWVPGTNTWTQNVTSVPASLCPGKMAVVGNNIYTLVNIQSAQYVVDYLALYKYDTATGLWTQLMANISVGENGVLAPGTLQPTFPGKVPDGVGEDVATPGYQYVAKNHAFVALDSDVLMLYNTWRSMYNGLPTRLQMPSISLTELRPAIGFAVKYTLNEYIAAQGLAFYEAPDDASRDFNDSAVPYNGSMYVFCPRSLVGASAQADRRSFKYTPDGNTAAPTAPVPADGSTVTTDVPQVRATILSSVDRKRVEWQFATDAAFTLNKRIVFDYGTYTDPYSGVVTKVVEAASSAGGTVIEQVQAGSYAELYQGTWYMRARTFSDGHYSPWTATQAIVISHPPALALSSPSNALALYYGATGAITFQWLFSDTSPTDYQTAYQLIVERNDTGALLLDTGKITSQVARAYAWNVPSVNKDMTLRWKMRAWDSDDVAGAYTPYNTFSMSDAPTVNVTAPAEGGTVNTGTPTVNWTFAASGGRTQASFRVRFYNNSNALQFDSGVITGAATTYTPNQQAIGVGAYRVEVTATDGGGLAGVDSNNFTTAYDTPAEPAFTVNDLSYETLGYIAVQWTSAVRDAQFVEWRVYRRLDGSTSAQDWELMYTDDDAVGTDFLYKDYTAGSGVAYEYIVVQAATRFGQLIESFKTNPQAITGHSTQYWLVNNDQPELNMMLPNVTADSYTDEWEEETLDVIGRGRHKDYGTRFGYTGQLTVLLRGENARSNRLLLENLKLSRTVMLLRNPFGDVWEVAMGNVQVSRIAGTGTTEMVDLTIPYEEVS